MRTEGILIGLYFLSCIVLRTFGQSRGDVEMDDVKYIDEAVQIVSTIFHKYKPEVPPRKSYPNPVKLSVKLHVQHVSELDVIAQTLDSTVELEVIWKDSRLSWYPLVVKEITVSQEKIWTPVLTIDNVVEAPREISSPQYVIKSNGKIYMYRRLQLKTFCETNLTATVEDCEIRLGSNLLNKRIIDFDMNTSSCIVSSSTHALQVSVGNKDRRTEERLMLRDNATFPEFICNLHIQETGCCPGTQSALLNETNGVTRILLSFYISVLIILLLSIL
ncbi:neuronal acetylcholine receptor subunit alpha-6-like isoform X2 [Mercenaria mercenaria]|uniref:neuronal acetylcholine receptor subunit alpha-6-like isoform X2 n=1 Tax=Mercenaria mercenaria TaxID=6596 RepID=UPI001E1E1F84|nr:neuronal acetylcholine receptor subunit alpha-6-like isoform X2 [Mercenaria mercenaria]